MSEQELRQEVEELKERVNALEAMIEDDSAAISRSMDLPTFVHEFNPSNHPERIAAIAYYREAYEGEDTFTTADIRKGYERARLQKPSNISDSIGGAESKGWVQRTGNDGNTTVRRLTKKGMDMVEEVMDDGA